VAEPRPAAPVTAALSQHRERGLRYLLVGAFNTLFGVTTFVLLQKLLGAHVGYLVVLVVSWVINVLEAFLTYRFLVFRVRGQFILDLARFSSVYAASFAFNLAALPLAVEVLGLPVIGAQLGVLVVVVLASYVAHSSFSFRRPPSQHPPPGDSVIRTDQVSPPRG
jgi:putative flippase GtrA